MLNIYNKKKSNNNYSKNNSYINNNQLSYTRFYLPFNKEWADNIYSYNKNYLKLLPVYNYKISNIIKSYFNMFNINYKNKIIKKNIKKAHIRLRRLSAYKILINKPELKHKNLEAMLNLSVFNAQKKYIINKFYKSNNIIKKLFYLCKDIAYLKRKFFKYNVKLNLLLFNLKNNNNNNNNKNNNIIIKEKENLLNLINSYERIQLRMYFLEKKKTNIIAKINKSFKKRLKILYKKLSKLYLYVFNNVLKNNNFSNIDIRELNKSFDKLCNNILIEFLTKRIRSLYINDLIRFNISKFKNSNMVIIDEFMRKIYNKKVITSIINLKYYFLNSDIMSQLISNKIRKRKKKPLRIIKKSLNKIKLPSYNKFDNISYLIKPYKLSIFEKFSNTNLFNLLNKKNDLDTISELLLETFLETKKINFVEHISNKSIRGIKIIASGRLSKRLTASRSVYIEKYIGGFKNIDSSFKGLSSDLIRGKFKQNIQYTNINSKVRNGSFGLKVLINN